MAEVELGRLGFVFASVLSLDLPLTWRFLRAAKAQLRRDFGIDEGPAL